MKENCVFCQMINGKLKSEKIYESRNIIAILDIDPINEGHILIIPKKHLLDLDEIPILILEEITILSKEIVGTLKKIYDLDGYSIMQNGGKFNDIGHYHLHIFPRFIDDGFGWTFSSKKHNIKPSTSKKIKKMLKVNPKFNNE